MRTGVLVFVLALVMALGVWWLASRFDVEAPPAGTQPTPAAPDGKNGPTGPPERGTVREPGTPPPANPTEPRPADPTPPPDAPAPTAAPNVLLHVRDLAARADVPAFRWTFTNSRGTQKGTGTNGRAELALEPSAFGTLLVEADGLAPHTRDVAAPTPPQPATTVDLFLGPQVVAAGITLHVRDVASRTVENVRVDAFVLAPDAQPTGWQFGQPLWARRNTSPDGRYTLPPLAAGSYGVRVVATDGEGALLPLLPWSHTFTLTGDNGFVEDVLLEPGALLALDLFDHTGTAYDPARAGAATLALRLAGGPAVQRKWVVTQNGVEAGAMDVLPGVGQVRLPEAVPPGQYTLEVFVNGDPRVSRPLFLRPGLLHTERVDVP